MHQKSSFNTGYHYFVNFDKCTFIASRDDVWRLYLGVPGRYTWQKSCVVVLSHSERSRWTRIKFLSIIPSFSRPQVHKWHWVGDTSIKKISDETSSDVSFRRLILCQHTECDCWIYSEFIICSRVYYQDLAQILTQIITIGSCSKHTLYPTLQVLFTLIMRNDTIHNLLLAGKIVLEHFPIWFRVYS